MNKSCLELFTKYKMPRSSAKADYEPAKKTKWSLLRATNFEPMKTLNFEIILLC